VLPALLLTLIGPCMVFVSVRMLDRLLSLLMLAIRAD
jgi:hypothetical protein